LKWFKEYRTAIILIGIVVLILATLVVIPLCVDFPAEVSRERWYMVTASLIGAAAVVIVLALERAVHKKDKKEQDDKHTVEMETQEKRHAEEMQRHINEAQLANLQEIIVNLQRCWPEMKIGLGKDIGTVFSFCYSAIDTLLMFYKITQSHVENWENFEDVIENLNKSLKNAASNEVSNRSEAFVYCAAEIRNAKTTFVDIINKQMQALLKLK